MTADARQQAEDAVGRVAGKRVDPSVVEQFTGKGSAERHINRERDALVRALADAIEETEAESADAIHGGVPCDQWAAARERLRLARIDRREALSTLSVEVDGARPHSGDSAKEDGDE